MKTRLATIATTMGLALGLTVAGVPAAQGAEGACTITNYSPKFVAVGLSPVTRTFSVSTTGCTLTDWEILTLDDGDELIYTWKDEPKTTAIKESQQVFEVDHSVPWRVTNADAGPHNIGVAAWNSTDGPDSPSGVELVANGFHLLHRTTWQSGSFNAAPEPAKKGSPISITGRLLVADWDKGRYVGYANRSIRVEFQAGAGAPWTLIKRVGTSADGWVRTTVPASASGAWRLRFGGTAIAAPTATPGDAVAVTG